MKADGALIEGQEGVGWNVGDGRSQNGRCNPVRSLEADPSGRGLPAASLPSCPLPCGKHIKNKKKPPGSGFFCNFANDLPYGENRDGPVCSTAVIFLV